MDMESQKYCLHFPLRWKYAMNAVYLRIHPQNVFRYTLFDLSSSWELMTVMIYCAQFTE